MSTKSLGDQERSEHSSAEPAPDHTHTASDVLAVLSKDMVALLAGMHGATRRDIEATLQLSSYHDRAAMFAVEMLTYADDSYPTPGGHAEVKPLKLTDFGLRVIAEAAGERRRWLGALADADHDMTAQVTVREINGELRVVSITGDDASLVLEGDARVSDDDDGLVLSSSPTVVADGSGADSEGTTVRVYQDADGHGRLHVDMFLAEPDAFKAAAAVSGHVDVQVQIAHKDGPPH
jgi:hypothetical protein